MDELAPEAVGMMEELRGVDGQLAASAAGAGAAA